MNAKDLKSTLNEFNKFVNPKTYLPVLLDIMLTCADEVLTLYATDLDKGLQLSIPAKGNENFEALIDYKVFKKLITSLPPKSYVGLRLQEEDMKLQVITDKTTYSLNAPLIIDEYPPLRTGETLKSYFKIDRQQFLTAIKQITFGASREEARPTLMGTHFHKMEGEYTIRMASTDGFRIPMKFIYPVDIKYKSFEDFNVSAIALDQVKILKGEFLEISVYNNLLVEIVGSNGRIVINEIEGSYPDYMAIAKRDKEVKPMVAFSFEFAEMLENLKSLEIIYKDLGVNRVGFDLKLDKEGAVITDKILMFANSESIGSAACPLKIQGLELSKQFQVTGLSGKFMSELAITGIERFDVKIYSNKSPVLFTNNDHGYAYVLMPVNMEPK